jgi:putative intracellular protease/amidase
VVTDDEERAFGTAENAPWLLASRLRETGAVVEGGQNWESFVVQDGRLITGQNPASAGQVADSMLTEVRAAAGRTARHSHDGPIRWAAES